MNKCVIRLVDGSPKGLIQRKNGDGTILEGIELIKYLSRIDESLFGRKARRLPGTSSKENGLSLIYISGVHRVRISS